MTASLRCSCVTDSTLMLMASCRCIVLGATYKLYKYIYLCIYYHSPRAASTYAWYDNLMIAECKGGPVSEDDDSRKSLVFHYMLNTHVCPVNSMRRVNVRHSIHICMFSHLINGDSNSVIALGCMRQTNSVVSSHRVPSVVIHQQVAASQLA